MSGSLIKFGVWKFENSVATITRDDLYSEEDSSPVSVVKRDSKDTLNRVIVKWTDISKESGYSYVIANDEVDQRISGSLRKKTFDLLGITNSEYATKMAYRLLAESMYRYTTYTFALSYRSMTLEVGDVVTLNDGFNIVNQRIRITRLDESKDGSRTGVEAIEDKNHIYFLPNQTSIENKHVRQVLPDLSEPNVYFTENFEEPIINLHICPQDEYFNAFLIYYSFDNDTYSYAGRCNCDLTTCNLDGVLLSALPSWPAVIHVPTESFHVEQNVSFSQLQTVLDDQFFNNQSLIMVEDEVIAFRDVSGTSTDFTLSNLIRGLFNTSAVEHTTTKKWHTVSTDFEFSYKAQDIGKTIYFKVLPIYATKMLQLGEVVEIPYSIVGNYHKPAPVSITRIDGREGFTTFTTNNVDVLVNMASRIQGANNGGFGVVLYGSYARDIGISSMELIVRKTDLAELYRESVVLGLDTETTYTKTITAAMRQDESSVIISITPGSIVRADERLINITKV